MRSAFFVGLLVTLCAWPANPAFAAVPQGIFAWLQRVEIDASDDPDDVVLWGAFAFAGDDQVSDEYPARAVGYLRFTCTTDRHACQDEWKQLANIAKNSKCAAFGVRMLPVPTVHVDGRGTARAETYPIAFGVVNAAQTGPGGGGGLCAKLKALGELPPDAGARPVNSDAAAFAQMDVRATGPDGATVDARPVAPDGPVAAPRDVASLPVDAMSFADAAPSAMPDAAPPADATPLGTETGPVARPTQKSIAEANEPEGCRCALGSRSASEPGAIVWFLALALFARRLAGNRL